MKNVKPIIELFLKHITSDDILKDYITYDKLTKEHFIDLAAAYMKEYTENELENIYAAVKDMVATEYGKHFRSDGRAADNEYQPLNLYHLLLLVVQKMLQFNCNEVVCQYRYLMDWRQLTVKISEDTFTTAFCAIEDLKARKRRYRFDWPTVIGNNNFYLNKLLQQEMSDNHFHLWASSPHFNLSWVRIMNDIDNPNVLRKFAQMNHDKLNVNQAYYRGYRENALEVMYLQAALIRLYLYSWMSGKQIRLCEYYLMNWNNASIIEQIENGVLPEYKRFFREWKCNNEEVSWLEQFKTERLNCTQNAVLDSSMDVAIGLLLDGIHKYDVEIARKENQTFWKCMTATVKSMERFPLRALEPVMHKEKYDRLIQTCTDETITKWMRERDNIQLKSRNIQLAINALKRGTGIEERID